MQYFRSLFLAGWACASAVPGLAQDSTDASVDRGAKPAWATVSEPLAVPPDASGLGFVRSQDTVVRLDATGQHTFVSQRIKLLHTQALALGNIAVAWNPAAGKPVFHTLRIIRGEETIDLLEKARFEVIRREDMLEQATLTGTLTALFKVSDLRVGDELEWTYTLPSHDKTLKDENAGILVLAGQSLPGRYHIGLSWDPAHAPRIETTDDFGAPLARTTTTLDLRVDNPPTLTPPKFAPPRMRLQRMIEYTDFASWPAVSSRFAGLFAEARKIAPMSPLKAEAAKIAQAHMTPLDRAQAALALVQDQVRYVYVGLDGGNYRPAAADETWLRRYGDCKGKTALLLALLDELGVAAVPVLVSNGFPDDGHGERLPSPGLFDHVIVRAAIGSQTYWLDGTLPSVATANTKPDFAYRSVLPLTAKGSDLVAIPWTPPKRPESVDLYAIDIRDGIDKPARIVTTSIRRGPAALAQHLEMSALTSDQLLEVFRSNLNGSTTWDSVDSVKYRFDVAQRAAILEIAGTGPLDWDKDDSGRRSMSLPGGGFSPPERRQRASENGKRAPFYDDPTFRCHVTTIRLPTPVDPGKWDINSQFDTMMFGHLYYRRFAYRDGTIRMIRGSRTERTEIAPDVAARDNERLERFDNSMAWLYFDPAGVQSDPLPAIDPADWADDWTGDAKGCVPTDYRG